MDFPQKSQNCLLQLLYFLYTIVRKATCEKEKGVFSSNQQADQVYTKLLFSRIPAQ